MKLIIAVPDKNTASLLEGILHKNNHKVEALCSKTHDLIDYVELLRPDLVILDLELPGKFKPEEITRYFNDVFDIPVVYLVNNSREIKIHAALETNPYGLITDPGDGRQVNFTLELAYNKFEESLYLL